MRLIHITATLMVSATLVSAYMGWATHRISPGVLASNDRWPRPWPYPDGWLFAWERDLDPIRRYYPNHPIADKGIGETERLTKRVRRLAWGSSGLAAASALLWMLACWRRSAQHRLSGAPADCADGLVPGPDGLAPSELARAWDRLGEVVRLAQRSLVRRGLPAGFVTGLVLAGLSLWPDKVAEPTPPVPLKCVHASFFHFQTGKFTGGRKGWAFWAKADGTAILQEIDPVGPGQFFSSNGWERRYHLTMTASQWQEIERLLGHHDFLRLGNRLRPRYGQGTKARIWVIPTSGRAVSIEMGKPQDHPDFQAVFEYLEGLLTGRAGQKPVYEGPYHYWHPKGF